MRLYMTAAFVLCLIIQMFKVITTNLQPGFLDFDNLPDTNFSCVGKVIGGYYADIEANCQMFHVCTIGQMDEPMDIRFLCLNGTVFDQETRVCERVDEVDCANSEQFYSLNLELYGNTGPALVEEHPTSSTSTTTTKKPITTTSTTTPASTTTQRHQRPTTISLRPFKNNFNFFRTSNQPATTTSGYYTSSEDDYDLSSTKYQATPVSYQHQNLNGVQSHVTVTTHTDTPEWRTGHAQSRPKSFGQSQSDTTQYNVGNNQGYGPTTQYEKDRQQFFKDQTQVVQNDRSTFTTDRLRLQQEQERFLNERNRHRDEEHTRHGTDFQRTSERYAQDQQLLVSHHPAKPSANVQQPNKTVYHVTSDGPIRFSFSTKIETTNDTDAEEDASLDEEYYDLPTGPGDDKTLDRSFDYFERFKTTTPEAKTTDKYQFKTNFESGFHARPQIHSKMDYESLDKMPRGFQKKEDNRIRSIQSVIKQEEKDTESQLPLPVIPASSQSSSRTVNTPVPFSRPDRGKRLPKVIISASATISDNTGKKVNISLGTIGPTLAVAIGTPPPSYDDYREEDVSLDPFYHDVPKIRAKHKRQTNLNEYYLYDTKKKRCKYKKYEKQLSNLFLSKFVKDHIERIAEMTKSKHLDNKLPLLDSCHFDDSVDNSNLVLVTLLRKAIARGKKREQAPVVTRVVVNAFPSDEATTVDESVLQIQTNTHREVQQEIIKEEIIDNPNENDDYILLDEDDKRVNETTDDIPDLQMAEDTSKLKIYKPRKNPPQLRQKIKITPRINITNFLKNKSRLNYFVRNGPINITSPQTDEIEETPKRILNSHPVDTVYINERMKQRDDDLIVNCAGRELNRFYGDSRDCRLFHYCLPGQGTDEVVDLKFVCDLRTFFDSDVMKCVTELPRRCVRGV